MHADDRDARLGQCWDLRQAALERTVHRAKPVTDLKTGRITSSGNVALTQCRDRRGFLGQRHSKPGVRHPAVAQADDAADLAWRELAAEQHLDALARRWPWRAEHAVEVDVLAVKTGGRAFPQGA